jgi:type III secretory pathway lipoprotein EscJ
MMMPITVRFFAVFIVAFCLLGCTAEPVAYDLDQRDLYEIVAVLREQGIDATATRERGAKGRFSLSVKSADYGKAVAILHARHLPAERAGSFSEMVAPSGLLPSSRGIEELRLDRARAAEIEEVLRGYPAVVSARVLVRSPAPAPAGVEGADQQGPSVSVVIQRTTAAQIDDAQLKAVVERALPGIKAEDIFISVHEQRIERSAAPGAPAEAKLVPFLVFWQVPAEEYNTLAVLLISLLIAVAGMAGLAGYILGQYNLSVRSEPRLADALAASPAVPHLEGPGGAGDIGGTV